MVYHHHHVRYRIRVASDLFLLFHNDNNELIGFVNGTRSREPTLTHKSMSVHEGDGGTLLVAGCFNLI